jgi:hypothetical protein
VTPTPPGRRRALVACLILLALLLTLPAQAGATTRWREYLYAGRVNDVAGPRSDGLMVISAGGKLWLVGGDKKRRHFIPKKRHRPRYALLNPGVEPYIAHIPAARCGFRQDDVFGLTGVPGPGLIRVSPFGVARPYIAFPFGFTPRGIVWDTGGLFGGQLLVIGRAPAPSTATQLYGVCNGVLTFLWEVPQRIEGGLAIAPPAFGGYPGYLLGADEATGNVYAVGPGGVSTTIATPPAAFGGDIGVESLGVVPPGMTPNGAAFLADRLTPGNKQTGGGSLAYMRWPAMQAAGVLPGDLLAATEGSANTFAIRCDLTTCTSQLIAYGLIEAHSEGHIAFATQRLAPAKPPKPKPKKKRAGRRRHRAASRAGR